MANAELLLRTEETTDFSMISDALIGELDPIVRFGSESNAQLTNHLLRTTFTIAPPTETQKETIINFITNHIPTHEDAKKRFLRLLPALAEVVDPEIVLNSLTHFQTKYFESYMRFSFILPVFGSIDHPYASASIEYIINQDFARNWEINSYDYAGALELFANKSDLAAITFLDTFLIKCNEILMRGDAWKNSVSWRDADGWEKAVEHMFRIKRGAVHALSHSQNPNSAQVLFDELAAVSLSLESIARDHNPAKNMIEDYVREVTSILLAKTSSEYMHHYPIVELVRQAPPHAVNAIIVGLMPDQLRADAEGLRYIRWGYDPEDIALLEAIVHICYQNGQEKDYDTISTWLRYHPEGTRDNQEHAPTLIKMAKHTLELAQANEFSFTHTPVELPYRNRLEERQTHALKKQDSEGVTKFLPTDALCLSINNSPFSKTRINAALALRDRKSTMNQRQRLLATDVLHERLKKITSIENARYAFENEAVTLAAALVEINPTSVPNLLALYPEDWNIKRGMLWALERLSGLVYN